MKQFKAKDGKIFCKKCKEEIFEKPFSCWDSIKGVYISNPYPGELAQCPYCYELCRMPETS